MYIIQEIQTTENSTALATAAVSAVNVHTVMLYDEPGNVLRKEFYEHIPAAE